MSELSHIMRPSGDGRTLFYACFEAMHTRMDLRMVVGEGILGEAGLVALAEKVQAFVEAAESRYSRFLPSSELSSVNAKGFREKVRLSEGLEEILADCLKYKSDTEGLFDVTMPTEGSYSIENHTLSFSCEGCRIDLSGYLKGWALDRVMVLLREAGVENAMVNFGNSSIGAIGCQIGCEGWRVQLPLGAMAWRYSSVKDLLRSWELPSGRNKVLGEDGRHKSVYGASESSYAPFSGEILLRNEFLTTSGNALSAYGEILNPLTRTPVYGRGTVSVLTPSATLGEVLSTIEFIQIATSHS